VMVQESSHDASLSCRRANPCLPADPAFDGVISARVVASVPREFYVDFLPVNEIRARFYELICAAVTCRPVVTSSKVCVLANIHSAYTRIFGGVKAYDAVPNSPSSDLA
jgi:hypothetical protein